MTVSRHVLDAAIALPDRIVTDGGRYVDEGSWVPGSLVVDSNDYESHGPVGWVAPDPNAGIGWYTITDAHSGTGVALFSAFADTTGTGTKTYTYARATNKGQSYTFSAWVRRWDAPYPTVKLGVAGIGSAVAITAPAAWTQVSYSWTATGSTSVLQLTIANPTAGHGAVVVDDMAVTATTVWQPDLVWHDDQVLVTGERLALDVKESEVRLDDSWSPYVQATLTCALPDAETLRRIDPRQGVRLRVGLVQRFGDGLTAADITADYAAPAPVAEMSTDPTSPFYGWVGDANTTVTHVQPDSAGVQMLINTATDTSAYLTTPLPDGLVEGQTYRARVYVSCGNGSYRLTPGRLSILDATGAALVTGSDQAVRFVSNFVTPTRLVVDFVYDPTMASLALSMDAGTATTWGRAAYVRTVDLLDMPGPVGNLAADLSATYVGTMTSAVTNDYGLPYNSFGMRGSTRRTVNLALRTRTVDWTAGTMTLEASSDEALAQDYAMNDPEGAVFNGTSIRTAIEFALAQIGAVLAEDDGLDAQSDDTDALTWEPGVSAWDYMAGLVSAAGLRLWCDERRAWHLTDPTIPTSGAARLTPLAVEISDDINMDGSWCDSVVVEYRWTDAAGAEQVRYDIAGAASPRRVKHVLWQRPYIRKGAAVALLRRLNGQGRSVTINAVSAYDVEPGQSFTIDLLDGVTDAGYVSSVAWTSPFDEMTVGTRDLVDAPAHSWLVQPGGVAWADLPAGVSWTDADNNDDEEVA